MIRLCLLLDIVSSVNPVPSLLFQHATACNAKARALVVKNLFSADLVQRSGHSGRDWIAAAAAAAVADVAAVLHWHGLESGEVLLRVPTTTLFGNTSSRK